MIVVPPTFAQVPEGKLLHSIAVVTPVILPSLPPKVEGATPVKPVGAAGREGIGRFCAVLLPHVILSPCATIAMVEPSHAAFILVVPLVIVMALPFTVCENAQSRLTFH